MLPGYQYGTTTNVRTPYASASGARESDRRAADAGRRRRLGRKCEHLTQKGHGRWYVRFEAPPSADGKRRQPRLGPFATEKAAKDALTDALGDVRSGIHTDDRRTTLAD